MIRLSVESKLLIVLLAVSVSSIGAVGVIAYMSGQKGLTAAAYDQLTSVRALKKRQIQEKFNTVRLQVANLSIDRMIVGMTEGLRDGAAKLMSGDLPAAWDQDLTTYYRTQFLPRLQEATGREPIVDAYLPRSHLAQYLQYWYIVRNPFPFGQHYKLDDAGDGSDYSLAHKRYQAIIAQFVLDFGYDNLYLINNDTADVIYTFGKSAIFGTNLLTGPYADSNAATLFKKLAHAKDSGMVESADFAPFAPAYGQPVALFGAPVFAGRDQIGVLFIQFPIADIDRVMTGQGRWESEGLGKTGEVYLVGADMLMRSASRLFIENPDKYFADLKSNFYSPEEIEHVNRIHRTTLTQRVSTTAAKEALAGHQGMSISGDYLGRTVLTSYAPLDVPGLSWVIIASKETEEAFASLRVLTKDILVSTVVIVLVVSVFGLVLGRIMVRPLYRLIDGIHSIGTRSDHAALDEGSGDEFGDLATTFNTLALRLRSTEGQLHRSEAEHDRLLRRILPGPAAERLRSGQPPTAERFVDTSIIHAELDNLTALTGSVTAKVAIDMLNDLIGAIDDAADRNGIEKLRTAGGTYLAACGLSPQRLDHANRAIDFSRDMLRIVRRIGYEKGMALKVRIAIASGPVLAGVVGDTRPTYDVWGETVDEAKALAAAARPDVVTVSESCHDLTQDLYHFERDGERVLSDGKAKPLWRLSEAESDRGPTAACEPANG